ncbi:hypothetical protein Ancab_038944 [Ancistrocladus abbreviatus]
MVSSEKDANTNELKPNYRGVKAMPFVIGNETFEKLGTLGTIVNLLVYLTTVFNMKSITATNLVNIFNGSANIATLIGAFLCDTYFGRYKTLGFACVSSFLGMLALTLTAAIKELHPPPCGTENPRTTCVGPTPGQYLFLIGGFALLVIGGGGIRPCNLAFGADQFNPETESGRRGISSFFNWYYFTFTFAMMISVTFIVYVQANVNWAVGLAIPAALMFLSSALFYMGTKMYVMVKPEGSPLVNVVQVIVAAVKKRHLQMSLHSNLSFYNHIPNKSINATLPHTDQFRFLDRAAIRTEEDQINSDGTTANPWQLASMQRVEEVKCIVRMVPIWISGIIHYFVIVLMQQNYVVFQALQLNRYLGHFQIPAASFVVFTMLAVTLWIPFYDQLIVPALRRITRKEGGITILQKIGFGIVLSVITMLVSGIVEQWRRTLVLQSRHEISSLSWAWLVPQLALLGLSEAFTIIGLVEFYYKQVPENMRSIGGSLLFSGMAVSSYLCSFIASSVHNITTRSATGNWLPEDLNAGRLDYFYYLIAGVEVVNFVYFLVCAKWYRYKGSADPISDVGSELKEAEKLSV